MAKHNHYLASPDRRRILQYGAALGGAAATASFVTVEALAADTAKVNMQLGWLASNGIMGEVVAKRMGYYEEEGIELEVTPGGPGWMVWLPSRLAAPRSVSSLPARP